jgi:hypothetical protein
MRDGRARFQLSIHPLRNEADRGMTRAIPVLA